LPRAGALTAAVVAVARRAAFTAVFGAALTAGDACGCSLSSASSCCCFRGVPRLVKEPGWRRVDTIAWVRGSVELLLLLLDPAAAVAVLCAERVCAPPTHCE
jgi:hypothetical protein